MLNDIASNTSFFGIFITGVAYVLACAIQKRFKASILNPLLVSCVILIIFMLVSGIDYNVYLYGKPKADGTYDGTGAIFFQNMLTPTTVCLAIPLYEKLVYLKKYPVAIIGGILAGMFACLGGVLVLSMAFGLDHTQYVTLLPKSITTAIGMGLAVTFVMGIASAVCFGVNKLLIALDLGYMQTVAFILVIAGLVQFIEMFLKKSMPSLYTALGVYLPLITTNCAVLGVVLLNVQNDYTFIASVVYGITGGLGFLLAIYLFSTIRERVQFADYPKCFEGFPIALITAGLIALAFMGFSGLQVWPV